MEVTDESFLWKSFSRSLLLFPAEQMILKKMEGVIDADSWERERDNGAVHSRDMKGVLRIHHQVPDSSGGTDSSGGYGHDAEGSAEPHTGQYIRRCCREG